MIEDVIENRDYHLAYLIKIGELGSSEKYLIIDEGKFNRVTKILESVRHLEVEEYVALFSNHLIMGKFLIDILRRNNLVYMYYSYGTKHYYKNMLKFLNKDYFINDETYPDFIKYDRFRIPLIDDNKLTDLSTGETVTINPILPYKRKYETIEFKDYYSDLDQVLSECYYRHLSIEGVEQREKSNPFIIIKAIYEEIAEIATFEDGVTVKKENGKVIDIYGNEIDNLSWLSWRDCFTLGN